MRELSSQHFTDSLSPLVDKCLWVHFQNSECFNNLYLIFLSDIILLPLLQAALQRSYPPKDKRAIRSDYRTPTPTRAGDEWRTHKVLCAVDTLPSVSILCSARSDRSPASCTLQPWYGQRGNHWMGWVIWSSCSTACIWLWNIKTDLASYAGNLMEKELASIHMIHLWLGKWGHNKTGTQWNSWRRRKHNNSNKLD